MVKLSNGLLDLAKASYDPSEIAFKLLRVDEILLDARQSVQQSLYGSKVNLHFEEELEDEQLITLQGNEYLLKVAFINLFENGCKYSQDQHCSVSIQPGPTHLILRFASEGLSIAEEDQEHIFTPFYRGSNKEGIEGNGIGLSLTQKIIDLHKGSIVLESGSSYKDVSRTVFTVKLLHYKQPPNL